jgi:hypothetical protein
MLYGIPGQAQSRLPLKLLLGIRVVTEPKFQKLPDPRHFICASASADKRLPELGGRLLYSDCDSQTVIQEPAGCLGSSQYRIQTV